MSVQNEVQTILTPEKVQATEVQLVLAQHTSKPILTVVVQGHEEGLTDIQIKPINMTSEKPVFEVVGKQTPAIGYFPYNVKQTFEVSNPDIQEILIQSNKGITAYSVQHLVSGSQDHVVPAVLNNVSDNQTVGYAYNQTNLDTAFQDAISQMHTKYKSGISAKVVDSGFVAAGSPVGIAYTYVVVEQQS